MIQATGSIAAISATTIKATNVIAMTNDMTIIIKTIYATITLIAKTRGVVHA
jgi:hypothetical protein